MGLTTKKRQPVDVIFKEKGYADYKWIDPQKIIVSQWVRMKCKFGCGEYGRGGACPPNTPSMAECERFFSEYRDAIILHFEATMDKPEDRHAWSRKINEVAEAITASGHRAEALPVDVSNYDAVKKLVK